MSKKAYFGGIGLLCLTILFSVGMIQDSKNAPPSAEDMALQAAMIEYATPGEHHEFLASRAGDWNLAGKMWFGPGTEAMEFVSTSTMESVMGGRYLIEHVEGEFRGETFQGMGIGGYDNLTGHFVGAWIDTHGTGIMRMKGKAEPGSDEIEYVGKAPDFATGKYKQTRMVEKLIDADSFIVVAYDTTPDGKEYKSMELTYTRADTSASASGR